MSFWHHFNVINDVIDDVILTWKHWRHFDGEIFGQFCRQFSHQMLTKILTSHQLFDQNLTLYWRLTYDYYRCIFDVYLMSNWCQIDVYLMSNWCIFDVKLMYIWCQIYVKLMFIWCQIYVKLMYIWHQIDMKDIIMASNRHQFDIK